MPFWLNLMPRNLSFLRNSSCNYIFRGIFLFQRVGKSLALKGIPFNVKSNHRLVSQTNCRTFAIADKQTKGCLTNIRNQLFARHRVTIIRPNRKLVLQNRNSHEFRTYSVSYELWWRCVSWQLNHEEFSFNPSRPNKYLPSEQEAFNNLTWQNIFYTYANIEWISTQ